MPHQGAQLLHRARRSSRWRHLYALLLGAMAQAPEGMSVADALALARDNKELMIGQIAAELKNI